ncbi:MAG: hypothetical protein CMB77_04170 [Euryarchaeota archaeon]|nr:hypothetical protein [Euryarchaeota archaeon]|tara:strand:+ start:10360 stop:11205 length:846 start_codon:yes stop_codon:yes gene_type:complete
MSEGNNEARQELFGSTAPNMPTKNVMRDDFGFEVPIEAVPLPSKGKIYDADSPLHGKETLEIKAMTAKDEDILTSRALIKKGTVITELLRSCLIDKSINPDDMVSGDRNAIMTALRVTGYGSEYKVEVECPACGERSSQSFDLTDMPINTLDIDPVSIGANVFEFTLPVTGLPVRFRFLTGAEEQEIMTISERRKKKGQTADNMITQRLTYSLIEVNGIRDKTKIQMFVKNMPAKDSLSLRRFLDNNEPGIDLAGWMECPHCTETSEVKLPLGASFFWPDA